MIISYSGKYYHNYSDSSGNTWVCATKRASELGYKFDDVETRYELEKSVFYLSLKNNIRRRANRKIITLLDKDGAPKNYQASSYYYLKCEKLDNQIIQFFNNR